MPLILGDQELIPAPLVNLTKNYVRNSNGIINYADYNIVLNGTIVNTGQDTDSPDADEEGLSGILREQRRIRNALYDGVRLQILPPPAGDSNNLDLYCTVDSVDFSAGVWVNRCDYTIVLKARVAESEDDADDDGLESFSENWSINENEDGTFSVTRQLSATGAIFYTVDGQNEGLEAARQWISDRRITINDDGSYSGAGIGGIPDVGPGTPANYFHIDHLLSNIGITDINFWNLAVVETVDPFTLQWNLTETFVYNPDGNAREEWNASIAYEPENPRKATITINGSVFGYAGALSDKDLRITNAKERFFTQTEPNLTTRIEDHIPEGFTINPVPVIQQYTIEPFGTITYSYSFVCFNGETLIPGAVDEFIDISDTGRTDIFASIVIPGRSRGPLIQNIETTTSPQRTVNITATLSPSGVEMTTASLLQQYLLKPDTDDIVDALKPSAGYYYVTSDQETFNPFRRQYSRSVSWTIDPQGNTVDGIPSAPRNTE